MTQSIKLADDTIDDKELKSLTNWILDKNQLTKGKLTKKFEKEFSNYIGNEYSVFVNSGSSANLLMVYALFALKRLKNKKVIVPAISWITTVSPVIQLGLEPILCDADSNNLGLDVNHFEELCKKHKPSLVILVHVLGHQNYMNEIIDICHKYNVLIVEDTCEALGTTNEENFKLGNNSLAASYSFYYGHQISTIEGGMVTTNDKELYNVMLSIRSHGWGRDVEIDFHDEWKKGYDIDEFRNLYTFYFPGFNLRSTDLNAYIGLSQLNKLNDIVRVRNNHFNTYKDNLIDKYWVQQSNYKLLSSFAFGTFVENRLETYNYLKSKNIETRPLICGNIGLQPFWLKTYGACRLPIADKVHEYGIYLPIHYNLSTEDILYVCECFNDVAIPI